MSTVKRERKAARRRARLARPHPRRRGGVLRLSTRFGWIRLSAWLLRGNRLTVLGLCDFWSKTSSRLAGRPSTTPRPRWQTGHRITGLHPLRC